MRALGRATKPPLPGALRPAWARLPRSGLAARLPLAAGLALAACHPLDDRKDGPADDSAPHSADTAPDDTGAPVERPELTGSPASATDLDADPARLRVALIAGTARHEVGGVSYEGYAYNGQLPGPTLELDAGATLDVDFQNTLDAASTVHWHGVEAPNAMDGVTWVSDPVDAGASFNYVVPLPLAGTYWYHPHLDTDHQVDLGLYGAIVVRDPDEPTADVDLVLVFDAWSETADAATDEHGLYTPGDLVWTVNGLVDPVYRPPAGSVVRVRALNASNTAYLDLGWPGLVQIAGDQGLLGAPLEAERVLLAPGDRAEFEWRLGPEAFDVDTLPWVPAGGASWGDPIRLLSVEPEGDTPAPEGLAWPFDGAAPAADPGRTDLVYVFAGGVEDEPWLINGESWPDVTPDVVALGEELIVEVRNLSPTEHPFHMHGNRFEVLSVDGVPPPSRDLEDTVNVPIRGVVRLRLSPANPGDWMVHCHLLGHEQGGMMTVLSVQ